MLEKYLGGWFPIMASTESKVLYLDGFAGPGRYSGGQRGSPLVALDTLLDHPHFPNWDRTRFLFVFLESDRRRTDNLKKELAKYFQQRQLPANVNYMVEQTTFAEAADVLLNSITEGESLIPTFAFVDPFGFKGIPLDLICRLLSFNKCELLINFMFDSVNRWVTADNNEAVHQTLVEMFGTDSFMLAPVGGRERQNYLLELYSDQLRARGFPYVRSMEMVSEHRGRTVYHLVYGTKHLTGVKVMKGAMWDLDPQLGRRFTPQAEDTLTLFGTQPDLRPLRTAIMNQFAGQSVLIGRVEQFVTEHTDFMADRHLKRLTLKPMEADGLIKSVNGRTRAWTYPVGCRITFAA